MQGRMSGVPLLGLIWACTLAANRRQDRGIREAGENPAQSRYGDQRERWKSGRRAHDRARTFVREGTHPWTTAPADTPPPARGRVSFVIQRS